MKAHGKFLIKGTSGNPIEMCGSDSFVTLDGRNSLRNHFKTMTQKADVLKSNRPHLNLVGFKIFKGELSYKDTEVIGYKAFN